MPGYRIGGGGGTAYPDLSKRAGLYLHPEMQDAGRVIRGLINATNPSIGSSFNRSASL